MGFCIERSLIECRKTNYEAQLKRTQAIKRTNQNSKQIYSTRTKKCFNTMQIIVKNRYMELTLSWGTEHATETGPPRHQLVQALDVSTASCKVPVFFHDSFQRKQSTNRSHHHP